LLDADVAVIYGVETKRVNEAVKNNPNKFPQDYMFELSEIEFSKTRVPPKAFTEKGLYMMARTKIAYAEERRANRRNFR